MNEIERPLPQTLGASEVLGDRPADDELHREDLADEALLQRMVGAGQTPVEPTQSEGRPDPAQLQNEGGMGTVLKNLGINTPPLPALRSKASLRTILEGLGPDLVAAQCGAINRFNRIADRAEGEDNKVLELLATKAAATYQHKLIELVVGRTVNVNASIKSQRDLPKLEKLTPEKRAQLHALVNEMTDTVDAEIVPDDEGTS